MAALSEVGRVLSVMVSFWQVVRVGLEVEGVRGARGWDGAVGGESALGAVAELVDIKPGHRSLARAA